MLVYKVDLRIIKQHNCMNCFSKFKYVMDERIMSSGSQADHKKRVKQSIKNDFAIVDCPKCGFLQPEMVAKKNNKYHPKIGIISGIIMIIIFLFLNPVYDGRIYSSSYILIGLVLASLLVRLFIEIKYSLQKVKIIDEYDTREIKTKIRLSGLLGKQPLLFLFLIALYLGAALCFYLPIQYMENLNEPINDNLQELFIGPGDSLYLEIPMDIKSIKGLWKSKSLHLTFADEKDIPHSIIPKIKPGDDNWDNTISVSSKSSKLNKIYLHYTLKFPENESLTGKTLSFLLKGEYIYPALYNSNSFIEIISTITKKFDVKFGSVGVQKRFHDFVYNFDLSGLGLVFLASLLFVLFNLILNRKNIKTLNVHSF